MHFAIKLVSIPLYKTNYLTIRQIPPPTERIKIVGLSLSEAQVTAISKRFVIRLDGPGTIRFATGRPKTGRKTKLTITSNINTMIKFDYCTLDLGNIKDLIRIKVPLVEDSGTFNCRYGVKLKQPS
jgi:hypothetical protein